MKDIRTAMKKRFSCRSYLDEPLPSFLVEKFNKLVAEVPTGPFGGRGRFVLLAAGENDQQTLRSVGTYGFIQGANAFVLGAISRGDYYLEDFGWQMEWLILKATELDLGTCWLGGSFTRSTFSQKMKTSIEESMPAIFSIGKMTDEKAARDGLLRRHINANDRLPWELLFFENTFSTPYIPGKYAQWDHALEMVRIGPSASNKQPWRLILDDKCCHFYLQRTKGYHEGIVQRFLGVEDLQRVDMGIAMCHLELAMVAEGLNGEWIMADPEIPLDNELTGYVATLKLTIT